MSLELHAKAIAEYRQERDWQLQSAKLHLAAARAKPNRPRWLWLPDVTASTLRLKAQDAIRRARIANHELIAARRLARETIAARISALAATRSHSTRPRFGHHSKEIPNEPSKDAHRA